MSSRPLLSPSSGTPNGAHQADACDRLAAAKPPGIEGIVCNISVGHAFTTGVQLPAPILGAFGGGSLHECTLGADCDLARAAREHRAALVRSRDLIRDESPESEEVIADLIFRFGAHLFLHAERRWVTGYATTREDAARVAREFADQYRRPPEPTGGVFELISVFDDDIRTESVPLKPETILSDQLISLHYGEGFADWHEGFLRELSERDQGLSIFEGAPGTGKTSYLRHLIGTLKKSHRFYLVSPSDLFVLTRPDFITFWARQRRLHSDRKFVIILEDAEEALMTRGSDNSAHVSTILNSSDGMLADFLRLQVICTMNCGTTDLDAALLRPGRLLCHRVFGRLDRRAAARLAERLGRALPEALDYSLAEIFAGHAATDAKRRQVGFAASKLD